MEGEGQGTGGSRLVLSEDHWRGRHGGASSGEKAPCHFEGSDERSEAHSICNSCPASKTHGQSRAESFEGRALVVSANITVSDHCGQ